MKQNMTAREELAQIQKIYFKGAGLAKAIRLEGDERRAFVLSQVERLLTAMPESLMALHLSDQFWIAGEGRVPMSWEETAPIPEPGYLTNPLLSLEEQQTLTDKDMARLRLILDVAGLCHDLSLHYTFDLKEAFGVKNAFWVTNKQLVEWLNTTPYERIAMHTAYIMKKHATSVYAYGHYQPAQDELAELYSMEYHELIRDPDRTKIPPRGYVKTIIDAIQQIERHWQRGRRLKLRPDLVMLHDEIYGVVPYQFDKGVLAAAQALYDYMDKELYGRLTQIERSYNVFSWNELPEAGKRASNEVLDRFAEKVREVRAEYLAEGWVTDDSLSFSYLMDHAQRCGYGWWREEDEAL